jgi:spoIIIJ-associated protein
MKEEIKKELQKLLETMGITVTLIEIKTTGRGVIFSIESPDSALLIGNHGETLDALTYLLRRVIENKFTEETAREISLDVNGYKEAQAERLKSVARMLAERAKMFKHDVEMEPMSSYERLVIHSSFENDPNIRTESYGEGRFRRVVIKYVEIEKQTGDL